MKNLILVYTGNGKGKTTAAIGQTIRALGAGFRVLFYQFVKSKTHSEHAILESLPNVDVVIAGKGFTWVGDEQDHAKAAQQAWQEVAPKISSGNYDFVVLDEISYTLTYGYIPISEVVEVLKNRPNNVNVVMTGRDMPSEIRELADCVSSIDCEKHHYTAGVPAQKGIEN